MIKALKNLFACVIVVCANVSCSDSDNDAEASPVSGSWRVEEVKISDGTLTQRAPNDEDIIITFEEGGAFTGSTSANTFGGRYEIEGTTLTMTEFTTTEVADTPFAGVFFDAISEAIVPNTTYAQFGFSFESQDLILIFGNSGEMVLEKQ
jgi:hypothetical protein